MAKFLLTQSEINQIKTAIANKEGIIEEMISDAEVFEYIADQQIAVPIFKGTYDSWENTKDEIASWLMESASMVYRPTGRIYA